MHKFLIEIPQDAYLRSLAKFEPKSREYRLLRNSMVLYGNSANPVVHLRCEAHKAQLIQAILLNTCPEFIDQIHYYPDLPRAS
jgi:hypothetical protein